MQIIKETKIVSAGQLMGELIAGVPGFLRGTPDPDKPTSLICDSDSGRVHTREENGLEVMFHESILASEVQTVIDAHTPA